MMTKSSPKSNPDTDKPSPINPDTIKPDKVKSKAVAPKMINNQLQQIIQKVDNWNQLAPSNLLSKLQEPTVQFVDTRSFTLMGIAAIIGKQNMKPLHQFLESINQDWVFLQAAVGLPIGDPVMNAEIKAIPHPDCQAIATAGRRMISVLEEAGLQPTLQEVADTQAFMLLEDRKQSLISQNATRWNAFCEAVNNWNGVDSAPEL